MLVYSQYGSKVPQCNKVIIYNNLPLYGSKLSWGMGHFLLLCMKVAVVLILLIYQQQFSPILVNPSLLSCRPKTFFLRVGSLDLPLERWNSLPALANIHLVITVEPRVSSLPDQAFKENCIQLEKMTCILQGHKPQERKSWHPGNKIQPWSFTS